MCISHFAILAKGDGGVMATHKKRRVEGKKSILPPKKRGAKIFWGGQKTPSFTPKYGNI